MSQAVRDYQDWTKRGLSAPRIAVNVSAIQLRQRDFAEVVRAAISKEPIPAGVDLEITESRLMDDIEANSAKLKMLKDLAVGIAIDDFGTGHSSLAYLAKLPVDTIKIDRSFVITMLNDANTMALVSTMVSLAHSLRLKVVAEGVEKEDQAKELLRLGCDEMQGYLFSKPLPASQLLALLSVQPNNFSC